MKISQIAVVSVAAVALALGGAFFWKRLHSHPQLKKLGIETEYQKLSSTQDPETVRRVLLILKNNGVPEGLEEALKRVEDPNPLIRIAVAEVLGFYPFSGKTESSLVALSKDSDIKVRLKTLAALSEKPEPPRSAYLSRFLVENAQSLDEKAACHFALFKLTRDLKERAVHLDAVFDLASNSALTPETVLALIGMGPKDARIIKLFRAHIEDTQVGSLLYRHLVFYAPETLKGQFAAFATHRDLALRQIAFLTVPQLCPSDRWSVIKSVMAAQDQDTRLWAMSAAERLGGKNAPPLAHAVLASNPTGEMKIIADRILAKTDDQDLCENPHRGMLNLNQQLQKLLHFGVKKK